MFGCTCHPLYICIVFHGIRFKVSKRLVVGRQSIFLFLCLPTPQTPAEQRIPHLSISVLPSHLLFCPTAFTVGMKRGYADDIGAVTHYNNVNYKLLYSPKASIFLYVFIPPKKAFTLSHIARFSLKIIGYKCEGLDFQVFTLQGPYEPLSH